MLWAPECSCSGRGMSKANISAIWCSPHLTYRNNCLPDVKPICVTIFTHDISILCQMLPRNKLGLKIAQVSFSLTSYWKDSGPQWCWKESEDATNASEITETTFMWKLIISFVHLSRRNMKLAVWTGQPQGSTQTFFCFHCELNLKGGSKFKNTSLQV